MKAGNVIALCAVAGLAASAFAAPDHVVPVMKEGKVATPKTLAKVRLDMSSGRPRVVYLQRPTPVNPNSPRADFHYVFDSYESSTGDIPGGAPGGDFCPELAGGSRYSLINADGSPFTNPITANDVDMVAGAGGGTATHYDWAYSVDENVPYFGSGDAGPGFTFEGGLQYYAFFADTFDATGNGIPGETPPSVGGLQDGFAADFTSFQFDPAFYYYSTGDLTTLGGIALPANDTGGAILAIHGAGQLTDGTIVLHPLSQPQLHGTVTGIGSSSGLMWMDDTTSDTGACGSTNTPDGLHTPGCELYTFDGLLPCPDPSGAMMAVGAKLESNPCPADCNGDTNLTVADFSCFRANYLAGSMDADCNGDTNLTVADFSCFRSNYLAGCP